MGGSPRVPQSRKWKRRPFRVVVPSAGEAGAPPPPPGGARLRLVAVEPAGSVVDTPVAPGTAVKLFTGSVIPSGADTVVKVEDTEERDGTVVVRAAPARGANVRAAGEDVRPGQVVVAAGTVIGPADLGVLASVGCAALAVHRRPRVAILPP